MSNSGKRQGSAADAEGCAGQFANQVAASLGTMATDAATEAGKRADEFVSAAGAQIQGFSRKMSEAGPQSGILRDASQAVANTVRSGGDYLHDQKFSGISDDLAKVIQRNPISAVLIALGIGWVIARRV